MFKTVSLQSNPCRVSLPASGGKRWKTTVVGVSIHRQREGAVVVLSGEQSGGSKWLYKTETKRKIKRNPYLVLLPPLLLIFLVRTTLEHHQEHGGTSCSIAGNPLFPSRLHCRNLSLGSFSLDGFLPHGRTKRNWV